MTLEQSLIAKFEKLKLPMDPNSRLHEEGESSEERKRVCIVIGNGEERTVVPCWTEQVAWRSGELRRLTKHVAPGQRDLTLYGVDPNIFRMFVNWVETRSFLIPSPTGNYGEDGQGESGPAPKPTMAFQTEHDDDKGPVKNNKPLSKFHIKPASQTVTYRSKNVKGRIRDGDSPVRTQRSTSTPTNGAPVLDTLDQEPANLNYTIDFAPLFQLYKFGEEKDIPALMNAVATAFVEKIKNQHVLPDIWETEFLWAQTWPDHPLRRALVDILRDIWPLKPPVGSFYQQPGDPQVDGRRNGKKLDDSVFDSPLIMSGAWQSDFS